MKLSRITGMKCPNFLGFSEQTSKRLLMIFRTNSLSSDCLATLRILSKASGWSLLIWIAFNNIHPQQIHLAGTHPVCLGRLVVPCIIIQANPNDTQNPLSLPTPTPHKGGLVGACARSQRRTMAWIRLRRMDRRGSLEMATQGGLRANATPPATGARSKVLQFGFQTRIAPRGRLVAECSARGSRPPVAGLGRKLWVVQDVYDTYIYLGPPHSGCGDSMYRSCTP